MRSHTQAATIAAAPSEVFDYISEPRNLRHWARAFARAVEERCDHWTATTAGGEMDFLLESIANLASSISSSDPARIVTC